MIFRTHFLFFVAFWAVWLYYKDTLQRMEDISMKMGGRIKEQRLAAGLTQEELGAKLGLQKSAIAKYENGRVENIKRSTISAMAQIFGCSPSYLMGLEDASTAPALCRSADRCQGAARDVVDLLLQLDREDQLIIQGEIRAMLRAEKYQDEGAHESPA